MRNKKLQWGILGLCAVIALVIAGLVLPPLSKQTAQSVRITAAVNSISGFATATPSTNAAPSAANSPPQQEPDPWPEAAKIKFRLDYIDADGLRGPPDGLVSVAYEFCVPADERVYQEVRRIDPSVQISPGSSGRIGCSKAQALCAGSTHQPRWRDVLKELSSLSYISEIRECFFERCR